VYTYEQSLRLYQQLVEVICTLFKAWFSYILQMRN